MRQILVVVDMQNDFLSGALGCPGYEKTVDEVVSLIGSKKWDRILYTMDTHLPSSYPNSHEGRNIPPHCFLKEEGWQLNPKVKEALDHANVPAEEVQKPTFGSTELLNRVKEEKDEENVSYTVCGVCTSICVLCNAILLASAKPESHVIVTSYGDGDKKAEQEAIDAMRHVLIEVR